MTTILQVGMDVMQLVSLRFAAMGPGKAVKNAMTATPVLMTAAVHPAALSAIAAMAMWIPESNVMTEGHPQATAAVRRAKESAVTEQKKAVRNVMMETRLPVTAAVLRVSSSRFAGMGAGRAAKPAMMEIQLRRMAAKMIVR